MTERTAPTAASNAPVEPSIDELEALNIRTLSPFQMAWKRYWRHKGAAVSTVIMLFVLLVVIFAPLTARYGINEQVRDISEG
ncbi:MAG: hypothetical protein ACKOAZ_00430, partial [Ilumatobacteraceae bacterium]